MPPNEQLSDPVQDVGGPDACPLSLAFAVSYHSRRDSSSFALRCLGKFLSTLDRTQGGDSAVVSGDQAVCMGGGDEVRVVGGG